MKNRSATSKVPKQSDQSAINRFRPRFEAIRMRKNGWVAFVINKRGLSILVHKNYLKAILANDGEDSEGGGQ
jgi:hypothetical protein